MSRQIMAGPLGPRDQAEVLARLRRRPRTNLVLIDLAAQLGEAPDLDEFVPHLLGAWCSGELVGVASLRPSIAFEEGIAADCIEAIVPWIRRLPTGLLKSPKAGVDRVWPLLRRASRKAVIDRLELGYVLSQSAWAARPRAGSPLGIEVGEPRRAEVSDLEALVHAARASLREEDRPDPFDGDPQNFRRWVLSRVARARVVECADGMAFVAYADVQRTDGWLVQGVYTWPAQRRMGMARVGMTAVIDEAFRSGADHVQLAVIDGNEAAVKLYQELGFEPDVELRTILFE